MDFSGEVEAQISSALSELPGAPWNVQINQIGSELKGLPNLRVTASNQNGITVSRAYVEFGDDECQDFLLIVKGTLYNAPPAINLEEIDKEMTRLKRQAEALTEKLDKAQRIAATWETDATLSKHKLAKIRKITRQKLK